MTRTEALEAAKKQLDTIDPPTDSRGYNRNGSLTGGLRVAEVIKLAEFLLAGESAAEAPTPAAVEVPEGASVLVRTTDGDSVVVYPMDVDDEVSLQLGSNGRFLARDAAYKLGVALVAAADGTWTR